MPSNANLHEGVEERVAKNPVKYAWIQTLIFQELQTHTCPGHKVMDTVGEPLALNFQWFLQRLWMAKTSLDCSQEAEVRRT